MLKKSIFFFISFFCCLCVQAQHITYPESVKQLMEQADARVLPGNRTVPVIAIPQGRKAAALAESVQKSGASAVIVPETEDGAALREMAAAWDSAVIPDGWVKEKSAFSVLFYKAVAERNLPHTGTSALSLEMDKGLMRYDGALPDMETLYRKAVIYKRAKILMDSILTLDGHGDLPCVYEDGYELGVRQRNQVSLQKMEEGHLSSRVLISYLRQKGLDEESSAKAFAYCDGLIDEILADIEKNKAWCGLARTQEDAVRLKAEGKKAFFLGIENGYGIGNDLRIGREVVKEMNRCGILVDVSHTSSGTFWDCIELSTAPIICSHSGAKAIFPHDRNITDAQLRALAAKDGLVMVYIVPDYMNPQKADATIDDFIEHLQHCIQIAGIDHVGISCDFDGGGGGWGLNGDNDVINITVRLLEAGFSNQDIAKLWSDNFFHVLETARQKVNN